MSVMLNQKLPRRVLALSLIAGVSACASAETFVTSWGSSSPAATNVAALAGGGYGMNMLSPDGTIYGIDGLSKVVSVASGFYHTLALREDGTVVAWGDNSYGAATVPPGLSNVVAIGAGWFHSMALKGDGTVVAWGWNFYGQTNVPPDLSNVVAVAGSVSASIALKADGTLVPWGDGSSDFVRPPPLSNVVAVAGGQYFGLALKRDGTLASWSGLDVPDGLSNVVAISAGSQHALALRGDGTVAAWGRDVEGQTDVPTNLNHVISVACGGYFSSALVDPSAIAPGNGSLCLIRRPFSQRAQQGSVVQAAAGQTFRFVAIDDEGAINYQWRHAGTNLPGATNSALVLTNIQFTNAGNYSLAASNGLSAGISSNAFLEILPVLTTISPWQQTVLAGTNVTFAATVIGDGPFKYQWMFNGTNLPGATNAALLIDNAQPIHSGAYAVAVSNIYGGLVSSNATLEVQPLTIISQPQTQLVLWGTTALLNVGASLQGPFTYQWRFNGAGIPGATNSALVLMNVQIAQQGDYSVAVSNSLGAVISSNATLFVSQVANWGDNAWGQTNLPTGLTNVVTVSGGGYQSVALNADGTITQWGVIVPPAGLSNIVALSSGFYHELGLNLDSTVSGWGGNNWDDAIPPVGLSNVIQVAAGYYHSLALKADGSIAAWGYGWFGQTNTPANLSDVVAIACGGYHSLALKGDGRVVAWGNGQSGQTAVPSTLTNVVAIAGGYDSSMALKADGTIVAWGSLSSPTWLSNAIAMAAGSFFGLALKADGSVVNFGNDTNPPPPLPSVVGVSAGGNHYVVLLGEKEKLTVHSEDLLPSGQIRLLPLPLAGDWQASVPCRTLAGKVLQFRAAGSGNAIAYQWRFNGNDLPGKTNATLSLTNVLLQDAGIYSLFVSNSLGGQFVSSIQLLVDPLQLTVQPKSQSTFLGATVTFDVGAVTAGPFRYQWKFNGTNILDATASQLVITNVQLTHAGLYSVAVSNDFGSALSSNAVLSVSRIAAWGYNGYGQTNVPSIVTNPVAISGGLYHSVALEKGGYVKAWGRNSNAQATVPAGLADVVEISAGHYHNLALRVDGSVVAWGAGTNVASLPNYGQSIVPTNLGNCIAAAGGGYHSLALGADGTVRAWGAGTNTTTAPAPHYGQSRVPSGLSNIVAIAAGLYHSLALGRDGIPVGWGAGTTNSGIASNFGQSKIPSGLHNVVAVAAGGYHSLALTDDGLVTAWGYNAFGQTNVPIGLTNVVAIGAGVYHSVALTADGRSIAWGAGTNSGGPEAFSGQAAIPAGLGKVQALIAGGYHTMAIVNDGSPFILRQPAAKPISASENVALSVAAIGAAGLQYQWQFNGTNIGGATNAILLLSNVPLTGAGNYQCIVSNSLGAVSSSMATLTVVRTPRFENASFQSSSAGANFAFRLSGLSAHGDVILYASTNLLDWYALSTNPAMLGTLSYTDYLSTNALNRFYRAVER